MSFHPGKYKIKTNTNLTKIFKILFYVYPIMAQIILPTTIRTTRDRPGPAHLLPLNSHLLEVSRKLSSMLTQEPLGGKVVKSIR